MPADLTGRTALVTGGSRGIGRAAALGFARAGADGAVPYHTQPGAGAAAAAEIRSLGRRATTVQADVTNPAEVERMMASVAGFARPGGPPGLFNNAGVYPPGPPA